MPASIIAADLHIQRRPGMWSGRAEISGDDVYAAEQIANLAEQYKADLYLLGDVVDTVSLLPRAMMVVKDAFGKLAQEGRLKYLQGQHEMAVGSAYAQYPWLSLLPGAQHIADKAFNFHGLKAFGLDYFPSAFEALAFSKIPEDVEVLFMHGTVDLALPLAFHFQASSLEKFTKLKWVFAGDWHRADTFTVGDVTIQYTGSTWQVSSDEPRDKSVILFAENGSRAMIETIRLKTRRIVKLSECYDDQGNFMLNHLQPDPNNDKMPKELQTSVILVDMPTDPAMYEELAKHGHLYTTSGANPDTPTRELVDKAGLLSNEEILQSYMDKETNPDQFAFTLDVIENPVDQSIKRLKDKFGMKDADRTVQPQLAETTEVNLDSDNPDEEEEVLA